MQIRSYNFMYFFRVLDSIKINFGQILVQLLTNILNLFLALLWILESSSRTFYYFHKMVIYCHLLNIFSGRFLILLIITINGFWLIVVGWQIRRGLDFGPSPPNCAKYILKILSMTVSTISISRPVFITKWYMIWKVYSKMFFCLVCYNNTYCRVCNLKLMELFEIEKI